MNNHYRVITKSKNVGEQIAGYHLLVDASGCDSMRIRNHDNLREFVVMLQNCLALPVRGEPIIERHSTRNLMDSRWSLVQLSNSASISAHFFEDHAVACIDVFLTRLFDVDAVRNVIERYFLPVSMRVTCVNRSFNCATGEETS
ncbi:MAG: S-adenosylmethionine decarboxylase [Gammaproteobacteria bacterium]